jgi:hypothetical protein
VWGPAALVLVFVALARWSWRKWADVVIDFGAELYVPWRLSLGETLYQDIAYRHGPLSSHLNALVFRIAGPSVDALVTLNLAILAALCVLVYRQFTLLFDRTTALATTLVLLVMFGFSHYVGIGNYNYVTPYQHGQTHGLVLSLAMVAALGALLRRPSWRSAVVSGLCLGLVLLTKLELQVPALVTAVVAAGLVLRSADEARGRLLLALLGATLVPPALALLLLSTELPLPAAAAGLLGNWGYLGALQGDRFYLAGAGLDAPAANLARAVGVCALLALFASGAIGLDRAVARSRWPRALGVCAGATVALALLLTLPPRAWFGVARALPVVAAGVAVTALVACLRAPAASGAVARFGSLALWATFAFALLGKMMLRARFEQYGFVLAMPATLLLVAVLVGGVPGVLRRRSAGGAGARAVALGAVAAICLFFLGRSEGRYERKTVPVGVAGDVLVADARRGRLIGQALQELEHLAEPDATVLVLPEGAGLNYWLRRRIPTRHYLFLPAEFAAFGEEAMLAELRERPPDWVLLVDRPYEEFGVGAFGVDPANGARLLSWVQARYERVRELGSEPFQGEGFGIVLLKRST